MRSQPGSAARNGPADAARTAAAVLLFLAWEVAAAAEIIGSAAHDLAPKLLTAFLLWRIWRGADWSRWLLIALSTVSAGFAGGLAAAIALGATGINSAAMAMFTLYSVVGLLLCTPPVRRLFRRLA